MTTQAEAQLALGQFMLNAGNHDAAFEAFSAAARSGDAQGFNMLGRCHELGWGTIIDTAQAAALYTRAAEMGDAWAMFNLADLRCHHDDAAAFALYTQAARLGHLKSLNMLGLFYEDGRHVAPDLAAAHAYFSAGAERGDCWAQFNLGRLTMATDIDAAAAIFEASLTNGFPNYWRNMGTALCDHPHPRIAAIGSRALDAA